MKRFNKIIALLLALACLLAFPVNAGATSLDSGIEALKDGFLQGEGPAVGKYSIDYSYFSPVKDGDSTKYPLVIWLHGMGDGSEAGKPVQKSNIAYWTSDEFQARFDSAGGAFIFAPRSLEEKAMFWSDSLVEPLKAAIDSFIAENKANIDLTKIYVGGYSMGGKMTLKMAIAYPEMFAAIFPICPAWSPSADLLESIADIPVWLTSSTRDPLVSYYCAVTPTWNRLMEVSNVKENCRFSTLNKVCYHDGTKTASSHHAWFAVNYDMFSIENGDYPYMTTVNGLGEEVTLTHPDGMISWLSQFSSDYDGAPSEGMGTLEGKDYSDSMVLFDSICDFFKAIFAGISAIFKGEF